MENPENYLLLSPGAFAIQHSMIAQYFELGPIKYFLTGSTPAHVGIQYYYDKLDRPWIIHDDSPNRAVYRLVLDVKD